MTFRRSLFIVGLVLVLLPLSCWAQDTPQADVFAGYSYVRVNPPGISGINLHGVDFSVAGNVNNWFGVVADLGYNHSSGLNPSANTVSYLFGPRFSYRANEKVIPFFQTLFGGVRSSSAGFSQNNFASAFGGGVDIKVASNIAIRPIQVEYLWVRSSGQNINNFRYSAGVVFQIGKK